MKTQLKHLLITALVAFSCQQEKIAIRKPASHVSLKSDDTPLQENNYRYFDGIKLTINEDGRLENEDRASRLLLEMDYEILLVDENNIYHYYSSEEILHKYHPELNVSGKTIDTELLKEEETNALSNSILEFRDSTSTYMENQVLPIELSDPCLFIDCDDIDNGFEDEFVVKDESMNIKFYSDQVGDEDAFVTDIHNMQYSKTKISYDHSRVLYRFNKGNFGAFNSARIENNTERKMHVRFEQYNNSGSYRSKVVVAEANSTHFRNFEDWNDRWGIYIIGSRTKWPGEVEEIEITMYYNDLQVNYPELDGLGSRFRVGKNATGDWTEVRKVSGGNSWSNSGGYTFIPIEEEFSFEIGSMNDDVMLGLSREVVAERLNWNELEHVIYVSKYQGNKILLYKRGQLIKTLTATYKEGDIIKAIIDRGNRRIKYYKYTLDNRNSTGTRRYLDYLGYLDIYIPSVIADQSVKGFYGTILIYNQNGSIKNPREENIGKICGVPYKANFCP